MTTKPQEHVIDAAGKRLGRVATEVATLLMGKNTPQVTRHIPASVVVRVTNAHKLHIDERKRTDKTYERYSGYPGGLRSLSMNTVIEQKGYAEVVKKAVYGMLPNNRLRAVRMKNLTVSE